VATSNHYQATQRLRNRAITQALEAALRLSDPGCEDVRIWPFLTEAEEHQRRTELVPYINSWIVGPLLDALMTANLGQYAGPESNVVPRVEQLVQHQIGG